MKTATYVLAIMSLLWMLTGCGSQSAMQTDAPTGQALNLRVPLPTPETTYEVPVTRAGTAALRYGWNTLTFPAIGSKRFADISVVFNGEYKSLKTAAADSWIEPDILYYQRRWFSLEASGDDNLLQPGVRYWLWSYKKGAVLIFTVPSISSLNPSSGSWGNVVTINGLNFGNAQGTVTFFDSKAAELISWCDTAIVCRVPVGETTGPVRVSAYGKESNAVTFTDTYGETWNPKETSRNWQAMDMSADGSRQTAVVYNGQLYVSSDYGTTWAPKESNRGWISVAMSADGSRQTAVVYGGRIYLSSDYGNTWTPKESSRNWRCIAMSADGQRQTALNRSFQIYVSSDYGNTWSPRESNRFWQGVTMSADGQRQTAVARDDQIFVSDDYGATWVPKDSSRNWGSVTMSANGQWQAASVFNGQIYVSNDYGNTWAPRAGIQPWYFIAMAADGLRLTAVTYPGQIYLSSDNGNSWTPKESNRYWQFIGMNADGSVQTALENNGRIYIYGR